MRLRARVTSVQRLENFVIEIWADLLQQLPDNSCQPFHTPFHTVGSYGAFLVRALHNLDLTTF